jgi:hypothetical protein
MMFMFLLFQISSFQRRTSSLLCSVGIANLSFSQLECEDEASRPVSELAVCAAR